MPHWMTLELSAVNGRSVALRLPLVVLWLFVLPYAVLLTPLALAWCMRRHVNPLRAAGTLWALWGASRGTAVDIEHAGAAVRVRIV